MSEQPLEDLLVRLERERREAERLYGDALTSLDGSIQTSPSLPRPPRPFDAGAVAAINARWDILTEGPPPIDRSLRGRLRGFVWRLVGPPLEAQRDFNAALVDHINRNASREQELSVAVARLLEAIRGEFDALVRFESLLLAYLRTITAYIDTKDRSLGGSELQQRLALSEQRILALKRDVEGLTVTPSGYAARGPAVESVAPSAPAIDPPSYVQFEDRFRGSSDDIRARVEDYVPLLAAASDVVDVGCGRGELLGLLRDRGVSARGVDANPAMVEVCRARGLQVDHADALSYLESQQDGTIGALAAIQVVEHFEPRYLTRFLEAAYHKMRPGAPLILETINPACWMAFFECYLRDLTHERPLHPDTLRHLVQAGGFGKVELRFRQPVPDVDRLDSVAVPREGPSGTHAELAALAAALNAHARKLNDRLFSSMDYVIIARR